jgi:hypothetical protein
VNVQLSRVKKGGGEGQFWALSILGREQPGDLLGVPTVAPCRGPDGKAG